MALSTSSRTCITGSNHAWGVLCQPIGSFKGAGRHIGAVAANKKWVMALELQHMGEASKHRAATGDVAASRTRVRDELGRARESSTLVPGPQCESNRIGHLAMV